MFAFKFIQKEIAWQVNCVECPITVYRKLLVQPWTPTALAPTPRRRQLYGNDIAKYPDILPERELCRTARPHLALAREEQSNSNTELIVNCSYSLGLWGAGAVYLQVHLIVSFERKHYWLNKCILYSRPKYSWVAREVDRAAAYLNSCLLLVISRLADYLR